MGCATVVSTTARCVLPRVRHCCPAATTTAQAMARLPRGRPASRATTACGPMTMPPFRRCSPTTAIPPQPLGSGTTRRSGRQVQWGRSTGGRPARVSRPSMASWAAKQTSTPRNCSATPRRWSRTRLPRRGTTSPMTWPPRRLSGCTHASRSPRSVRGSFTGHQARCMRRTMCQSVISPPSRAASTSAGMRTARNCSKVRRKWAPCLRMPS